MSRRTGRTKRSKSRRKTYRASRVISVRPNPVHLPTDGVRENPYDRILFDKGSPPYAPNYTQTYYDGRSSRPNPRLFQRDHDARNKYSVRFLPYTETALIPSVSDDRGAPTKEQVLQARVASHRERRDWGPFAHTDPYAWMNALSNRVSVHHDPNSGANAPPQNEYPWRMRGATSRAKRPARP